MALKKIINFVKRLDYALVFVVAVAAILRLVNLGYSDFQGDEIRAQYLPVQGEGFFDFLMRQRKGPFQFIISYLISFADPSYKNYFIDRLPFALAGIFAIYFFYKFAVIMFNKRVAFFASLFLATNGFFVALSRILQYQGFVFLFCALALYYFALLYKNPTKIKYLYMGMFVWGLSMLTHYDGLFIAPFIIYLLALWWAGLKSASPKYKLLHILASGVVPALLIIVFYGAMVMSLSLETKQYWEGRLTGTTSAKSAGTSYLFRVYQPYLALQVYLALTGLALVLGAFNGISFIKTLVKRNVNWSPEKFFNVQLDRKSFLALFVWLAFPLLFMEKLVSIPGTHIYTYLLPLSFLMAASINWLYEKATKVKIISLITNSLIIIFFSFVFYQSYMIFVDNTKEYPWENESFLFWEFRTPDISRYHLSLFGFPYYRNWQAISDYIKEYPEVTAYTSNENNSITNYYLKLEKDTDKAGFYVYIRYPQTFKNITNNEKYLYWSSNNPPVFTISRRGNALVNVYLMPVGSTEQLKQMDSK
jgi:4-amino-4-deoxy-L-arabinose transferase-like glycosyltransferase